MLAGIQRKNGNLSFETKIGSYSTSDKLENR